MDGPTRTYRNNWVIKVECNKDKHQAIIRSAVAKRAYLRFEQRGYKYGLDLEDWIAAEKEFLVDDFSGNTSEYRFVIESTGDPEVTTILSLTTHSLVVFRSHPRYIADAANGPEVVSVHVMPDEIDPTRVVVKSIDGLLHLHAPKRKRARQS